jgi:murein DD-endopeptidase MepM/ murein hydrolase activator NlpD
METLFKGAADNTPDGPVHGALFLLAGHNVFGKAFFFGPFNGKFGAGAGRASTNAKLFLGYPDDQLEPSFGPRLHDYLLGKRKQTQAMLARQAQRGFGPARPYVYPAKKTGKLIGRPGEGTHSFIEPPDNWESDNAIDIALPFGTRLVAVADGEIGTQFGALNSTNPRFLGLRCHLVTANNEFYYAHLSKFASGIKPGVKVKQGRLIGFSGAANGVNHLHIASKHGNPVSLLVHPTHGSG